ncbi:MAG: DUF1292 domain-containing protein [Firmicutes bacterium HGW-Firmicutes-14]|jgi:uncharacterized protein YrzB (UPF0473 family)|nr:MAG: DUF1292 domain-containing protein [Firmicutes bacterium HGW-Firmicutes-14]
MTEGNEVLTLTDEEGNEHQFSVIDIIEMDNSEYAILLPLETAEEDEEEAIILRIDTDDDGNEVLVDIEDDDEWEKVADTWASMVEEEEA